MPPLSRNDRSMRCSVSLISADNGVVDIQSAAAFGEATVNITSTLSAFGGVRYTNDHKEFTLDGVKDTGVLNDGVFPGRVGLRQVDPGNYIQAGSSTGIVVLTLLHPISVIFTVPEDSLPQIMTRVQSEAAEAEFDVTIVNSEVHQAVTELVGLMKSGIPDASPDL